MTAISRLFEAANRRERRESKRALPGYIHRLEKRTERRWVVLKLYRTPCQNYPSPGWYRAVLQGSAAGAGGGGRQRETRRIFFYDGRWRKA